MTACMLTSVYGKSLSEMDLKLKDHVVVNEAMGKKSNMDGDQLTDFDKTELRTKSQIGCPNILFKHSSTK